MCHEYIWRTSPNQTCISESFCNIMNNCVSLRVERILWLIPCCDQFQKKDLLLRMWHRSRVISAASARIRLKSQRDFNSSGITKNLYIERSTAWKPSQGNDEFKYDYWMFKRNLCFFMSIQSFHIYNIIFIENIILGNLEPTIELGKYVKKHSNKKNVNCTHALTSFLYDK